MPVFSGPFFEEKAVEIAENDCNIVSIEKTIQMENKTVVAGECDGRCNAYLFPAQSSPRPGG
jgi:hypothetical protein